MKNKYFLIRNQIWFLAKLVGQGWMGYAVVKESFMISKNIFIICVRNVKRLISGAYRRRERETCMTIMRGIFMSVPNIERFEMQRLPLTSLKLTENYSTRSWRKELITTYEKYFIFKVINTFSLNFLNSIATFIIIISPCVHCLVLTWVSI